jgi:hypothetical protein
VIRAQAQKGLIRFSGSPLNERLKRAFDGYEEFIGLKEVKKTQLNVLASESEFVTSSKIRRGVQNQLIELQDSLKQVRQKLDSTHRSDETYLELITNEHKLIKKEIELVKNLRQMEDTERDLFSRFSQTLRDAHEVERLRQEKTKYLSLIGSVAGAILGIIATSINHALKMKDVKQLVKAIETQNAVNTELILNGTSNQVKTSDEEIQTTSSSSQTSSDPVIHEVRFQGKEETTSGDATSTPSSTSSSTPSSDPHWAELLSNTESNLEYKMKVNSLTTVVLTYALIAISVPILMRIFGD